MAWWKQLALGALMLAAACAQTQSPAPAQPPGGIPRSTAAIYGAPRYDTTPPTDVPGTFPETSILVISKTNGYRHADSITAANAMFQEIAQRRGWGIYVTENGAVVQPDLLARFDVVVFNNVSGDVLTAEQRETLRDYIQSGGGFVAFHGSGGDFAYEWPWYVNNLIGAQFIGHPMPPRQFQQATIHIEDRRHPATRHLPAEWQWTEEWYSFARSARRPGYRVLGAVDESTYIPGDMRGIPLAMGEDHPVLWWHCQGRGRAFYSALGHRAESYADPNYRQVLEGAVTWAARLDGEGCGS
jgi:type 1 glutamine amidotransferase